MNRLPRATTSDELSRFRRDNQWSKLHLIIPNPPAVYTARVNGAPASTDQVVEVTYDTGSGTLADVKPGMTLWVGSSAGAYNKGQTRIRLSASGTKLFIGETSDIDWADNDYLTVVDEFGIWARHLKIDSGNPLIVYMDYNIVYTDQHLNRNPIPVLGLPRIVWLRGLTIAVPFDASASWRPGGATVTTYLWAAPNGGTIDDDASPTPVITFSAPGIYRVDCTVTMDGVASTGYRSVYVCADGNIPDSISQFTAQLPSGSLDEGGYNFSVEVYADAPPLLVRDRAMAILFSVDYYGEADGEVDGISMGYVEGSENLIGWGWISGESIEWSPETSKVSFSVNGPHYWLGQVIAFPTGLLDTLATPGMWTYYQNLNAQAALWHFLYWRSTAALCMDCVIAADTRRAAELSAPSGGLFEQLRTIAYNAIFMRIACDRLGRLFGFVEEQLTDPKTGPDVMTILKNDLKENIVFGRTIVNPVSQVNLSGVYFDGATPLALFSLATGHIFTRYGRTETIDRLALGSAQVDANLLCGRVMGWRNNEYPSVQVELAANNRFLDIAPPMWITLTLPAADTPRGIGFTKRFIPRRVAYQYNASSGAITAQVDLEGETFATLSITGDGEASPPSPPESIPASMPPITPPANGGEVFTGGGTGDNHYLGFSHDLALLSDGSLLANGRRLNFDGSFSLVGNFAALGRFSSVTGNQIWSLPKITYPGLSDLPSQFVTGQFGVIEQEAADPTHIYHSWFGKATGSTYYGFVQKRVALTGAVIWTSYYSDTIAGLPPGLAISVASDGIYFSGALNSGADPFLKKLSKADGSEIWSVSYGTGLGEYFSRFVQDAAYLYGANGSRLCQIRKSDGSLRWSLSSLPSFYGAIATDGSEGLFIGLLSSETDTNTSLKKLQFSAGSVSTIWTTTLPGPAKKIVQANGYLYVISSVAGVSPEGHIYLTKVNPADGAILKTLDIRRKLYGDITTGGLSFNAGKASVAYLNGYVYVFVTSSQAGDSYQWHIIKVAFP